ncbi:unnamed protein product [Closterium sp. NIES-53]
MPTRKLDGVRKLGTPSVSQAAEAALRGVWETTHLPTPSAGAKNHHLLRYLHHCCRRLHPLRHRRHGLHCRHRLPHSLYHPHHHLDLLHRLHRFPHRPLHHPCFPCPCRCGITH